MLVDKTRISYYHLNYQWTFPVLFEAIEPKLGGYTIVVANVMWRNNMTHMNICRLSVTTLNAKYFDFWSFLCPSLQWSNKQWHHDVRVCLYMLLINHFVRLDEIKGHNYCQFRLYILVTYFSLCGGDLFQSQGFALSCDEFSWYTKCSNKTNLSPPCYQQAQWRLSCQAYFACYSKIPYTIPWREVIQNGLLYRKIAHFERWFTILNTACI